MNDMPDALRQIAEKQAALETEIEAISQQAQFFACITRQNLTHLQEHLITLQEMVYHAKWQSELPPPPPPAGEEAKK